MKYSNPYFNVAGINEYELFFNRENLIRDLLNQLLSGHPSCISIVGQRKIGKTSLLKHLLMPETIRRYGYLTDNYIFVFFDCQLHQSKLGNTKDFLFKMLDELKQNSFALKPIISTLESQYDDIHDIWIETLRQIEKRGLYIIFIFDEFEKAVASESLHTEGLFGNLRAFIQAAPIAYVTSTQMTLSDLFHQAWKEFNISEIYKQSGSEFYNVMLTKDLGLFSEDEIMKLITNLSASMGVHFTMEEIQQIHDFGGNFPFFVQRACYYYFNSHSEYKMSYQTIRRSLFRECVPIWADYWSALNEREKKILSALADDRDTKSTDYEMFSIDPALIYLGRDGKWHLFSKEFGKFIQNQHQPIEQRLKIGQWLDHKRYKIIDIVSTKKNFSSQVVKAWDERWSRDRAIKLVRPDDDAIETQLEHLKHILRREAEILINLSHPNIGKVFDIMLDPVGIVMEWVDGIPLLSVIKSEKTKKSRNLSSKSSIEIAIHLADALIYLHNPENHIVHRDIKPNNIIIMANDSPKLIDFGIAKDIAFETISRREDGSQFYIGTPSYSSPEQFLLSEEIGPPTDIFSFGMVLYEMLAHKAPFTYRGDPHLYADRRLPKPDAAGLPQRLYPLFCRLLSQEPERRPSAVELKRELQDYLSTLISDTEQ
ncbi:MAG: protein kinase [Anaerolineae bacterium]|jgi:serine/threonine-protein kinase|nr:protein kinase [Bacteroidota bacterium]MBT4311584.1 protein kinase [Anaerolineae bacterium]MBT5466699.1 protein kinase [Candidatus Neomarinimicrobiota bacterium]MBT6814058.1 protein kinase [Anaerolineae bacterium]